MCEDKATAYISMPGPLYLAGRKLPVASDDLIVPGILGFLVKFVLLGGTAACLGLASNATASFVTVECPNAKLTAQQFAFLIVSVLSAIAGFILYAWMIRVSLIGTIVDWKLRHVKAETMIHLLVGSYALELIVACFGVAVLAMDDCPRHDPAGVIWPTLIAAVVVVWADLVSASVFAWILYNYLTPGTSHDATWYQLQLRKLGIGFQLFTCGILDSPFSAPQGSGEDAWIQFSEIVHLFVHDMMSDIVITDILAALLLIRAQQKRMQAQAIHNIYTKGLLTIPGSPQSSVIPSEHFKSPSSSIGSPPLGGVNDDSSKRKRLNAFLWEKNEQVNLKMQALASSSAVSTKGSWISQILANEGRAVGVKRKLEAFSLLREFDSYAPYMVAMYGWKLQIYDNPIKFILSGGWIPYCGRWFARGGRGVMANPDNSMPALDAGNRKSVGHSRRSQRNKPNKIHQIKSTIDGRVFASITGLQDHHVIYASFTAYLGEAVPYTISVDHDREAIVIACRGTLSFADLVTDLMASPVSLELSGRQWNFDGTNHYAHGGMLQVAGRIRLDIEKQGILDRLYKVDLERGEQQKHNSKPVHVVDMLESEMFVTNEQLRTTDISNYALRVVGHSLGGGVASILSLLLRPKYPSLKCFAYEPPGCIFSRQLADQSTEWVNAMVIGSDIVPRLSWHSAKQFRGQIFEMLRCSKTTKARVLSTLFVNIPAEQLLFDDQVPVDEIRVDLAKKIQSLAVDSDSLLDRIPMFLPGKILHLAKQSTSRSCGKVTKRSYTPLFVNDRDDFHYDIRISQFLLWDHIPSTDGRVIRQTLEEITELEKSFKLTAGISLESDNPQMNV